MCVRFSLLNVRALAIGPDPLLFLFFLFCFIEGFLVAPATKYVRCTMLDPQCVEYDMDDPQNQKSYIAWQSVWRDAEENLYVVVRVDRIDVATYLNTRSFPSVNGDGVQGILFELTENYVRAPPILRTAARSMWPMAGDIGDQPRHSVHVLGRGPSLLVRRPASQLYRTDPRASLAHDPEVPAARHRQRPHRRRRK